MLKRGLSGLIVILFAVAFSSAQSLSFEEAIEQIQPLVAELAALRAVSAMNLSPQQAQKLLEISKRAQAIWSEYREQMREVLREQVEAFTAFRAEDLLNVGFTPETERRTAVANLKGKNLTKWLADSLAPLVDEASRVLTDEQRSIAEQLHSANLGTVLRARLSPVLNRGNRQLDPVAEIRKELAEIHRVEYGEITPLGRFLLNPALVSVLERQLGLPSGFNLFRQPFNDLSLPAEVNAGRNLTKPFKRFDVASVIRRLPNPHRVSQVLRRDQARLVVNENLLLLFRQD